MLNLTVPIEVSLPVEEFRIKDKTLQRDAKIILIAQTILNVSGAACVLIPCDLNTKNNTIQGFGALIQIVGNLTGTILATLAIMCHTTLQNQKERSQMVILGTIEARTLQARNTCLAKCHIVTQVGNLIITGTSIGIMLGTNCLQEQEYDYYFPFLMGLIAVVIVPMAITTSVYNVMRKRNW